MKRRNPRPSRAQVRALLEHAPRIVALENPVVGEAGNGFPVYSDWWWAFIEVANQDWFLDWDYEPGMARVLLNNRERLALASFHDWSGAFTLFLRAERFSEGYWSGAPRTGEAAALLVRLAELERDWVD